MKKLVIQSVSGNSAFAQSGYDPCADSLLRSAGFREHEGSHYGLSIGAIPGEDRTFAVNYEEPAEGAEDYTGRFQLIETTGGRDREIDHGSAGKSHTHGGTGAMTFYGRGRNLKSWSFHCKQE